MAHTSTSQSLDAANCPQKCSLRITFCVSYGNFEYEQNYELASVSSTDARNRACISIQTLKDKVLEGIGIGATNISTKIEPKHRVTSSPKLNHVHSSFNIKPLEESFSGSSQGHTSSSREAFPTSPLPQKQQYNIQSISTKPHAELEEVVITTKECISQNEHESQLPAAISEVSTKQQCVKPNYAGILLRGGHRQSSRRRRYAQNRMSCPDFPTKIPENTVLGALPLVLNASISRSSYSLKGIVANENQCGVAKEQKIQGQDRNPHCQETGRSTCFSKREEGARHCFEKNDSANFNEEEILSSNSCLKEVSAVQEQQSNRSNPSKGQQRLSDRIHTQRCIAQPASGSTSGHTPSHGTQPNNSNPLIIEPLALPRSPSSDGCFVIPEINQRLKEFNADGSQFVFPKPIVTRCYNNDMLPEVKEEGFPPKEDFKSYRDGHVIHSSKKFTEVTQLSSGTNCGSTFPPSRAVQQLVKRKFVFDHERPCLRNSLIPNLPKKLLLGSGGNGITFEHTLMDEKYAVKWMDYLPKVFDAWSRLDHPNIIPLLAVVKVDCGCYVIMPRMTGNLGSAMKAVGDLHSLARSEGLETWQNTVMPNVQHILGSVLRGVAFFHKEGYQHRDLKETNILYHTTCGCDDIIHCKCPPECKCDVVIADFDSLKSYHVSSGSSAKVTNAGTISYRSPEAQYGMVAPCCDMWSIGVIITSLCHTPEEKQKIMKNCKRGIPNPGEFKDERNFETAFGREMLSSLRNKCIEIRDRLEELARIASLCLNVDNDERITAEKLLEDYFLRPPH